MRPSTRIVLLVAVAALLPAGVSIVVWVALADLRNLAISERAAWSAAAAAIAWLAVALAGGALGTSLERRPLDDDEDIGHLGEDHGAGELLSEDGVEDLVTSVDLAGLSRVADAINAEIDAPPGPSLKRFLLFARPARPRRRRARLNSVIEVALDALRQAPAEGGNRLLFDPDPNVDRVPVDPDALHRALVNLVRNAREAAGPQGTIEVRTQALGDRVLVAVRDDGPGVPPENLERIFQPFYTTRPGAMGLGLSICRQIAEAHGGAVFAVNVMPRGLEVGLELPLSRLPLLPGAMSAGTVRQA